MTANFNSSRAEGTETGEILVGVLFGKDGTGCSSGGELYGWRSAPDGSPAGLGPRSASLSCTHSDSVQRGGRGRRAAASWGSRARVQSPAVFPVLGGRPADGLAVVRGVSEDVLQLNRDVRSWLSVIKSLKIVSQILL